MWWNVPSVLSNTFAVFPLDLRKKAINFMAMLNFAAVMRGYGN